MNAATPRNWTRSVLVVIAALALGFGVAGFSASSALALCKEPPCTRDPGDTPPPPPPPVTTTTITGISPGFAWSGDTVTLTGTGFTGASVSINNVSATISSATSTRLSVVVPSIVNVPVGPVTIPVVVSSPTGTASTSFTLSPTLQVSAGATFGVNSQFGQGADGSAGATATLDRSSGIALSELTVKNTQTWLSLNVNMSTVWLNSSGVVIGFTSPVSVTSTGWMFHWPSGDTTASGSFTQVVGPNPGVAPFTRSARILLTRDGGSELQSTLTNAVALGQTIYQVISTLAPFFV
jgi:hypothetical protein